MSGCSWGWLRVDGQYVWCGEPGPRLDAPGAPGGRAPLREQPAWGALGKAEQWGGGVAGACALAHSASWEMRASGSCSRPWRWPGFMLRGILGADPGRHPLAGAGGALLGQAGASPGAGFPRHPQALPQASGALPRGLEGPQAPSNGSATTVSSSPQACNC